MTLQFYLLNAWRWKCGFPELENITMPSLSELQQTEWSIEFEQLMRNRLIIGAMRYGRMGAKNKPQYDRISSIIKRLHSYINSGNKELLVDVANLAMMEFVECYHPSAHFHALDDSIHVNKL